VLLALLRQEPPPGQRLEGAQDGLVSYCVAAGVVHRVAAAFALFDGPQARRAGG
jgi:hypothetical protein